MQMMFAHMYENERLHLFYHVYMGVSVFLYP